MQALLPEDFLLHQFYYNIDIFVDNFYPINEFKIGWVNETKHVKAAKVRVISLSIINTIDETNCCDIVIYIFNVKPGGFVKLAISDFIHTDFPNTSDTLTANKFKIICVISFKYWIPNYYTSAIITQRNEIL